MKSDPIKLTSMKERVGFTVIGFFWSRGGFLASFLDGRWRTSDLKIGQLWRFTAALARRIRTTASILFARPSLRPFRSRFPPILARCISIFFHYIHRGFFLYFILFGAIRIQPALTVLTVHIVGVYYIFITAAFFFFYSLLTRRPSLWLCKFLFVFIYYILYTFYDARKSFPLFAPSCSKRFSTTSRYHSDWKLSDADVSTIKKKGFSYSHTNGRKGPHSALFFFFFCWKNFIFHIWDKNTFHILDERKTISISRPPLLPSWKGTMLYFLFHGCQILGIPRRTHVARCFPLYISCSFLYYRYNIVGLRTRCGFPPCFSSCCCLDDKDVTRGR